MLRRLVSFVFYFILLAATVQAGGLHELSSGELARIAPGLRARLEQDAGRSRIKDKTPAYRLVVTLRSEDSSNRLSSSQTPTDVQHGLKGRIIRSQNKVLAKIKNSGGHGFRLLRRYQSLYGFSAEAGAEDIYALAGSDHVVRIEEMPLLTKMDEEAFELTCTEAAHAGEWTGKGVTVAVIDDGLDIGHEAFGGYDGFPNAKIIGGYDFADYDDNPDIDCREQSHGTATAGVAVGNGDGVIGTAPDANLVFLKVQRSASCGQSVLDGDIIGALDWVITHREEYGIRVVSMSMGTEKTYAGLCTGSALDGALRAARDAGLVVVTAAGNSADPEGLSSPACHPDTLSVGAVYDASLGYAQFSQCADLTTYADLVSCYSNSSDFLDILAPAHCATTARAGGGLNYCFGGTSSSTPYIAGVAATLFEKNRDLTRSELIDVLLDNGDPVTDPRNNRTSPRVNHGKSLFTLDGDGSAVTRLTNGAGITGLDGEENHGTVFCLNIPDGVEELTFSTSGGEGDADLYVRHGIIPTRSTWDCSSVTPGTMEECRLSAPKAGIYYVLLYSDSGYTDLSLQGNYRLEHAPVRPVPLVDGLPVVGLAGEPESSLYFQLELSQEAETLRISLSGGSGDADLLVKYGDLPAPDNADCMPYAPGNDELCVIDNPRRGLYYIRVSGDSPFAGVTLLAGWEQKQAPEKSTGLRTARLLAGPLSLLLNH